MLDFLFSAEPSLELRLRDALRSVALDPDRPIRIFSGDWGCLAAAGRPYPCFDPIETDRYVIVVLGGPLPRHDFTVATASEGNDGTSWILDQWKLKRRLRWDEDLVGHFAVLCVDKSLGRVEAVTDINSFVPLYATGLGHKPRVLLLGSHVDGLAVAADRLHDVDEVSIGDFLTYTTVTYPYTLYRNVQQLPPAALHRLTDDNLLSEPYWTPRECDHPVAFDDCARRARDTLVNNVERICSGQETVGVLLGGGEDSRVVASVSRRYAHTVAVTFADTHNREVRIASRIADELGIDWQLALRTPTHYLDNSDSSLMLAESHRQFLDAHSVGLLQHWPTDQRLLGGHLADVLLKGHYVAQKKWAGIALAVTEHPRDTHAPQDWPWVRQIVQRRSLHRDRIRQYRPQSSGEWARLWPASQLLSLGHLAANRRLYPTYEPFIDSSFLKLAALSSQRWTMNRRLFHAAMKPLLYDTRHVPHSKGFYPYYGLTINAPLQLLWAVRGRILSAVNGLLQRSRPNQGPWPVWNDLADGDAFRAHVGHLIATTLPQRPSSVWPQVAEFTSEGAGSARFRALQLLEWANWRSLVDRPN